MLLQDVESESNTEMEEYDFQDIKEEISHSEILPAASPVLTVSLSYA